MKVFSAAGLLVAVAYFAVIAKIIDYSKLAPDYVSPFTAGVSGYTGGNKVDLTVSSLQSAPIIVVALFLVYMTPRLF